ncbi:PTS sugar transporter subunit IIA [Blastopirellula retiformator]|uniref:Nitrogen regulatory protein n=1 Tax=Blastopirellula retiformator TaxID=2527970 RepID=A0A5C5VMK0_9BACT|nr:PTS sugar transporter subunit IIA [Blastopirellula retiformator]TWT39287.1 Nitrogen regulatory protein [Blastopirellula retiformator]
MTPASRAPEGESNRCPLCGDAISISPSRPPGDAPCPNCGVLLWWPALQSDGGFAFLVGEGTLYEIAATTKEDAIATLVRQMVDQGGLDASLAPDALAALYRREEVGTTAIGGGVAIPHARIDGLDQVVGILGCAPHGVDFGSVDGAPVTHLFLLVGSQNDPSGYLRALEAVAKAIRAIR